MADEWIPFVDEGKTLDDLSLQEWIDQAVLSAQVHGRTDDNVQYIADALAKHVAYVTAIAMGQVVEAMRQDLNRKLVSWEMGNGEAEGVRLPILRAHVVDGGMSVHNKTHSIDLVLPNDDAVGLLRETLSTYLKAKKAGLN